MTFATTELRAHMARERARAKDLRRSAWWSRKTSAAQCYYCETPLLPDQATMDHVVPLSQGGRSTPGNIVVSCGSCNAKKYARTAVEWLFDQDTKG